MQYTYDAVKDILDTTFTEELAVSRWSACCLQDREAGSSRSNSLSSAEWHLDDTTELDELLCGVCLDVGDSCVDEVVRIAPFKRETGSNGID